MKYKYFGTAAAEGIPAMYCECEVCRRAREFGGKNIMTRSQSLIDDKILIDYPADTYMHILQGLPITKIYTYLITHDHSDHLYPGDLEMRRSGFAHMREERVVDIYSAQAGCRHIQSTIGQYHMEDRAAVHRIEPYKPFSAEGYNITPLKANHGEETDPVIYLIEKDGKCVLHSNDTGYYTEETWKYLRENPVHIDFASFDCTLSENLKENNRVDNHMNYVTVLNVRSKLKELGCIDENTICVINHFSHNGGRIYEDLLEMVKNDGFLVSYDGMEVEF